MEAPPSRWRVVERGGRLTVIDSVTGDAPPTARDLLPGMASLDSDAPLVPERPEPRAATVPSAPTRAQPAEPPGAAQSVAETVTGNSRDDRGRLLLTTARWYDAKGPRTLTLSEAGERQLGGVVIALTVAAVVAVVLVVMGDTIGWVIVVSAIVGLTRAKPIATAWLDRLSDI